MNLSCQSASRPTHQLLTVGRDARAVLVDADDGRVNHLHRCIIIGGQRVHKLVPHASSAPASETIEQVVYGPKFSW